MPRKLKKKPKKERKVKAKKAPAEPRARRDINAKIYRDLFKFLEGKVSTECFINIHDQCYGKADCECECHPKQRE